MLTDNKKKDEVKKITIEFENYKQEIKGNDAEAWFTALASMYGGHYDVEKGIIVLKTPWVVRVKKPKKVINL